MGQICNNPKDIPGHHGWRVVIGQSNNELEVWTLVKLSPLRSAPGIWRNGIKKKSRVDWAIKYLFSAYIRSLKWD